MVRRYYDLPSLTALAVFEASARHLSFRLAAAELNVTPGAVSRQVKAVEDELGVPLFLRLGTGVALTSAGQELYAVLASSLSKTADVVRSVRHAEPSRTVTLACTDAFASMWLIPRMPEFWRQHEDITVDHLISDDARDYRRAEVELRVRYGSGSWPDERAELLFDEAIYPVCGPGFAEAHRATDPASLAALPLLHVDWVDPDWTDWDEVFRRVGLVSRPRRGYRVGTFAVALQAARADQGVALGWHRLVRRSVETRTLVRLTDLQLPAPGSYYLTWNNNRTLSFAAQKLRAWLREVSDVERRTS